MSSTSLRQYCMRNKLTWIALSSIESLQNAAGPSRRHPQKCNRSLHSPQVGGKKGDRLVQQHCSPVPDAGPTTMLDSTVCWRSNLQPIQARLESCTAGTS